VLERLEPRGFQTGATSVIKMMGKNLAGITAVDAGDPRVKITSARRGGLLSWRTRMCRAVPVMCLVTARRSAAKLKLHADDLPQGAGATLPRNAWGTLLATGQQDLHTFHAEAGQTIVLDRAAKRAEFQGVEPDAGSAGQRRQTAGHGARPGASGTDPFIALQSAGCRRLRGTGAARSRSMGRRTMCIA